jgi:hypothetical protein
VTPIFWAAVALGGLYVNKALPPKRRGDTFRSTLVLAPPSRSSATPVPRL